MASAREDRKCHIASGFWDAVKGWEEDSTAGGFVWQKADITADFTITQLNSSQVEYVPCFNRRKEQIGGSVQSRGVKSVKQIKGRWV